MVIILYGAPKTCQLFKVSVVLPPSGKISAGAHVRKSIRKYMYMVKSQQVLPSDVGTYIQVTMLAVDIDSLKLIHVKTTTDKPTKSLFK